MRRGLELRTRGKYSPTKQPSAGGAVRTALLLRRRGDAGHAALYTFRPPGPRVADPGFRAFLLLIASSLRPPHTPIQPQPSDPAQASQIWQRRSPPLRPPPGKQVFNAQYLGGY